MGKGKDKEKLLLIGYRAYGDFLYACPALPYLFEKYDIHLETSYKGYELFHDDKRFKSISIFDIENYVMNPKAIEICQERWRKVEEFIKPDKVINLWRTLETECIAERHQNEFYLNAKGRQKAFGDKNFHESVFKRLEVPMPEWIEDGGVYFQDEHEAWAKAWREKHISDFLIVMPVAGSCTHKFWPLIEKYTRDILDKYHNAYIYLVGDKDLEDQQWDHPRIDKLCGKLPFKQVVLMAKYADYVIGPETGTLVAAGIYGTPKTMMCTASGLFQCVAHHKNDYSLQAKVKCSPCHRAIYTIGDCESVIKYKGHTINACVAGFDYDEIIAITDKVYNERNIYNRQYLDRYVERGQSEIGKKIYDSRWSLIERFVHGNQSLLDYGCAAGAFHKSSTNGFRCIGYDVNPYSEFHVKPDMDVDILTMWDVIEHLHDPMEPVKAYKPEWLFVSTPNAGAVDKLEGWLHYRPGEHLHYFTLDSLTKLFNDNGYDLVYHEFSEGAIRNPERPEDIISVVGRKRHGRDNEGRNKLQSEEERNEVCNMQA